MLHSGEWMQIMDEHKKIIVKNRNVACGLFGTVTKNKYEIQRYRSKAVTQIEGHIDEKRSP